MVATDEVKWHSEAQRVSREGKAAKRVRVEWVGGVNAQNTLHQTKALLRAGCVSSPFMLLYFLLKDNMKKVIVKGNKVKCKLWERTEKVKRGGIIREARETVSLLPAFSATAQLESFVRLFWMAGLLLGRRGLKSGCCGDTNVRLSLLRGQSVYSPQPQKDPESHRTRDC